MCSSEWSREFGASWLPHLTDGGLSRLTELLADASPLLIHGTFTGVVPQGCPATHAGWHHPRTRHLTEDAGVVWLTRVANLNPATSAVVLAWDDQPARRWEVRAGMLGLCRAEGERRCAPAGEARR